MLLIDCCSFVNAVWGPVYLRRLLPPNQALKAGGNSSNRRALGDDYKDRAGSTFVGGLVKTNSWKPITPGVWGALSQAQFAVSVAYGFEWKAWDLSRWPEGFRDVGEQSTWAAKGLCFQDTAKCIVCPRVDGLVNPWLLTKEALADERFQMGVKVMGWKFNNPSNFHAERWVMNLLSPGNLFCLNNCICRWCWCANNGNCLGFFLFVFFPA